MVVGELCLSKELCGAREFYVEHIVEHNIVEFNEKCEPCNFGSDLNVWLRLFLVSVDGSTWQQFDT